ALGFHEIFGSARNGSRFRHADLLDLKVLQSNVGKGVPHFSDIPRGGNLDLDFGAAGEIDPVVQSLREEKNDGREEEDDGNSHPKLPLPHEVDVGTWLYDMKHGCPFVRRGSGRSFKYGSNTNRFRAPGFEVTQVKVEENLTGEDRREKRRDDPDEHRDGETLHWAGSVDEKDDRSDRVRHVRVQNRAERLLVSALDRSADRLAGEKLFPNPLVDDDVRVDGDPDGQRD